MIGALPKGSQIKINDYVLKDNLIDRTIYQVSNLDLSTCYMIGAIKQVRIHWLLDLLKVDKKQNTCISNDSETLLVVDFSKLDRVIHHLYKNNLRPGFEIMGNPGGNHRYMDPFFFRIWEHQQVF